VLRVQRSNTAEEYVLQLHLMQNAFPPSINDVKQAG
jgi:hypothetical protein